MNLQENIQRIREMMGLIIESDLPKGFDSLREKSLIEDDEVKKLQEFLKSKGYDLGSFGPNRDGIDGRYGSLTRRAHESYLNNKTPQDFNKEQKPDESKIEKNKSSDEGNESSGDVVIFMAGLEKDMNKSGQSNILKKAIGNKNVITHSYTDFGGLSESIKNNPNAYVVLFSAGCSSADKVASIMSNKNKLFLVEPYSKSTRVASIVKSAVNLGVPASNVIVGPVSARGAGVVQGATKNTMGGHFDALIFVSKFIN